MFRVFVDNHKFIKQIKYVFMIIEEVTGVSFQVSSNIEEVNEKDIIIAYVKNIESMKVLKHVNKKIIIENSMKLFGNNYLNDNSIPRNIKKYVNNKSNDLEIISIYNSSDCLFVDISMDKIHTNMDIIADMFFMLSRYEEVVSRDVINNEPFKRFSAKESLAFKFSFLDRAIVNEDIELIFSWIRMLDNSIEMHKNWGNGKFIACLTHDVDWIQKHKNFKGALRNAAALVIKHKSIASAIIDFKTYFKSTKNYKDDMYWTFNYIISAEKDKGFYSSFYFMSGGNSNYDNNYSYDDFRIKGLINELNKSGFECGYHGSFNSYNDEQMMKLEKNNLDKVLDQNSLYGIRQHYLRFAVPETWKIQQNCGFLYDSTLGYADNIGFRAGFCYPFRPYDVINNEVIDIWEIPLIVMESSLMKNNYSNCTPEEAYENVKSLINTVKKHNGVFTFLWHNSSFDTTKLSADKWKKVYEDILRYLYNENCCGVSGREVIRLYKNNRFNEGENYYG